MVVAIGALLFRESGADERRQDTLGKTVDLASAALAAKPPGPVKAEIVNDGTNRIPVDSPA